MGACFVTFMHTRDQHNFLEMYERTSWEQFWDTFGIETKTIEGGKGEIGKPVFKSKKDGKKYYIEIEQADEPSNIIWKNFAIRPCALFFA